MTSSRQQHSRSTVPLWQVANVDLVKAHLANAALIDEPECTIGDITLMPHQRDALARVRDTMRRFHGALLADEVGLGKTYVALALAREYDAAHVIAPAALLPMWHAAISRAAAPEVAVRSLHHFSRPIPQQPTPARTSTTRSTLATADSRRAVRRARSPQPPAPSATHSANAHEAPGTPARRELVIIDEAHHLRTRNTKRYHAIARFVAGRDVLLLSATPIHNSARELGNLLALFTGQRSDLLTPATLAQLVIRHESVGDAPANRGNSRLGGTPPRVHEHPPLRIASDHTPHDRASLDAILSLPDPLPARDGAVAGALIRLGLLRAWCSSNATLCHVIRRRLLRGEALKQALIAGRHPSQAELRAWLVGDHEVQLAFPELLAPQQQDSHALLERLEKHLGALRALLDQERTRHSADTARAQAVRDVLARHPHTPIVAFSQFGHTVHALYRALSDIAGVGALTGMHARIASGRIDRADAIARFAPLAQGRPQPPPHQSIRLLLSTDLLAEGVNLQDAAVVIHLDLPWTDALKRQRVGRISRLGSPHPVVHVYTIQPPLLGDRALQLSVRLLRKAKLATRLVGTATNTAERSAPNLVAHLHRQLRNWQQTGAFALAPTRQTPLARHETLVPVAAIPARVRGWIAAVMLPEGPQLVAHIGRTGSDLPLLAHAVSATRRIPHGEQLTVDSPHVATPQVNRQVVGTLHPSERQLTYAYRQLQAWWSIQSASASLGAPPSMLSTSQQHALQCLAQATAALPPIQRHALAQLACTAEAIVLAANAEGPQEALTQWTAAWPDQPSSSTTTLGDWLRAWRDFPALAAIAQSNRIGSPTPSSPDPDADPAAADSNATPPIRASPLSPPSLFSPLHGPALLALLLLRPHAVAPASLCSGYDATRPPL